MTKHHQSKLSSFLCSSMSTKKKHKSLNFEAMDDEKKVCWSELLNELWYKIGNSLENHIDVLRLRSVCEFCRSSIPSSLPNSPSFPLRIPHPINHSAETHLNQATIYRIEPSDGSYEFKLEPLAPPSSKGWLVKVEESKHRPLILLSPISDRKIVHPRGSSKMLWNLLDYRVIEICKSYTTQSIPRFHAAVNKVVFFPNSPWIGVEDCVACCIFEEGKLGFIKLGDEKWTLVDDKNFHYDDVIVFKNQFYVTDRLGTISWVDTSSLKLIQFSPLLSGFGNKKHLVESCGSLYVIDRFYESEPRKRNYFFKVYKLDEEWGTWVDVKNLKDRAFILSKTCSFSVSTKDVTGYQRNCIYFTDAFDVYMYNLNDHSVVTIDFDPCVDKFMWSESYLQRVRGQIPVDLL